MSWDLVLDVIAGVFLLLGSFLSFVAALGIVRFPDLLTRMHAATKPQVLGLLLVVAGIGLRTRNELDVGMLLLVALFQLLTIPAGAHMVSRAGLRTGRVDTANIHVGPNSRGDQEREASG